MAEPKHMSRFYDDGEKKKRQTTEVVIEKIVHVPTFVEVEVEVPIFTDKEYERPVVTDKEYERPVVTDKEYERPVIRQVEYEKPIVTDKEYERPIIKEKEVTVEVPIIVERPYDMPVPKEVPYDLPVVSMEQVAEIGIKAISVLSEAKAMIVDLGNLTETLRATIDEIKTTLPKEIVMPTIVTKKIIVEKPEYVTKIIEIPKIKVRG